MLPLILRIFIVALISFSGSLYAQDKDDEAKSGRIEKQISTDSFEQQWKEILNCKVMFYSVKNGESTLEEGAIYRYLLDRGYQITDSGEGYFTISHVHENFLGYAVEDLTLPGEWGVYGMGIVGRITEIKSKLFPKSRFVSKVDKKTNKPTLVTQVKSDNNVAISLVLSESQSSPKRYITHLSCFIEYGN